MRKVYMGTQGKGTTLQKLYYCLTARKVQIYRHKKWLSEGPNGGTYFPTLNDAISHCIRSGKFFNLLLSEGLSKHW